MSNVFTQYFGGNYQKKTIRIRVKFSKDILQNLRRAQCNGGLLEFIKKSKNKRQIWDIARIIADKIKYDII